MKSDRSFLNNEKRELREVQGLPILTPLHTWPLCEAGRWMLDCTFVESHKLESAPSNYTTKKGVSDAVRLSDKLLV